MKILIFVLATIKIFILLILHSILSVTFSWTLFFFLFFFFQDVSARYVSDYTTMLTRRTAVDESWLKRCVASLDMSARLRSASMERTVPSDWLLSGQRRDEETWSLEDRKKGGDGVRREVEEVVVEEVVGGGGSDMSSGETKEESNLEQLSEAERRGRTTGSVEWRAARGELGQGAARVRALCTTDQPVVVAEESATTTTTATTAAAATMTTTATTTTAATIQERVRVVFQRLVDEGKAPNEAAAMALTIVRAEHSSSKQ